MDAARYLWSLALEETKPDSTKKEALIKETLISTTKAVIHELKTTQEKQVIYDHICQLQAFCYKSGLRYRLYTVLKRKGILDYSSALEKNKFTKNGKPMTLIDLHAEFSDAHNKVLSGNSANALLTVDLSAFQGTDSKKAQNVSWEQLQLMLKTTVRFLLEFVCENKVEDNELSEFLTYEGSLTRQVEDETQRLDFRNSEAIVFHLSRAIQAYKEYQVFHAGLDSSPAAESLKNAAKCAFESFEFACKYYIYTRTKIKVDKKLKTVVELREVERFRNPDRTAMNIHEIKQQFTSLHQEFVKDFGEMQLPVNLNDIHDGWQVYTDAKHLSKTPPSAKALAGYIQHIIRFVKHVVLSGASNTEFEDFLALASAAAPNLEPEISEPDDPAWEKFYSLCSRFDSGYHYVLVAPEGLSGEAIGNLFCVDWDLIIDFNPATENGGMMDAYRARTGKPPEARVPERTTGPFRTISPPYWIRANGVYDDPTTICRSVRQWRNRYGQFMKSILLSFHSTYSGFLKIIYLPGLDVDMQAELMVSVEQAFSDESGLHIRDVEQILLDHHELADDFSDDSILCADISLAQLLTGISSRNTTQQQNLNYHLPGMDSNATVSKDLDLEDFCEPVYEGLGTDASDLATEVREFYRGARPVSWRELALNKDLIRDAYRTDLLPELKRIMRDSEHFLYSIRYKPGLGGTTLLRRIAWDMHLEYPTIIIRRYYPNCEKKLQALRGQISDGRRLLLLIDSNDMSRAAAENLFRALQALSLRFFMIYLSRKEIDTPKLSEELFILKELNPQTEVPQMVENLMRVDLEPRCKVKLERLRGPNITVEDRTPFFLAMHAFDKDFVGFRSYVAHFLEEPMQRKYRNFLVYIALYDLVTNGPALDAEFFVYHMDGVRTRKEARDELCRYGAFKSLVLFQEEKKILTCKFRYSGIARAVLSQITNNNASSENVNYLNLAQYVTEFIQGTCIRGKNDNLLDFLKRLLIDRDEIYVPRPDANDQRGFLVEERERFSPLIIKIGTEDKSSRKWTDSGRIAVRLIFRTLAECYPDNPHFIAHYARFLSEQEVNYAEALTILDRALSMGGDNVDKTLLHMKGTVYSRLATEKITEIRMLHSQGVDVCESVQLLREMVNDAQEVFSGFQSLGLSGVTGLLSDCKLCVRVIEMGMYLDGLDSENFFLQHKDDWYMILADRANSLFEACEKYAQELDGEDLRNYQSVSQSIYTLRHSTKNSIAHFEECLASSLEGERVQLRRHLVRTYLSGINNEQDKDVDRQAYWRRIRELTDENISEDPANSANFRHWFRAAINCHDEDQDQLMIEALQKVNAWLAIDESSPDVQFYRYILNFLQAVDGSGSGSTQAEQNMEYYRREMQRYSTAFTRKTDTRYWLGPGRGLQRLVPSNFDVRNPDEVRRRLQLQTGRLHYYEGERKASIRSHGAEIFFMPQQSNGMIREEHFDSKLEVLFFVGFSYDGPRAHNATVELKTTQPTGTTTLNCGDHVRCSVLERKGDYLLLSIRDSNEKAKIYIRDLLHPYSEENIPAVMTDLNVVLLCHTEIFEGKHTEVGWLSKMDDDTEVSGDFNKPLTDNLVLREALKRFKS